jgi:hypothetical protein
MVPDVPRGVPASVKITDEQVWQWIAADKTKTPAAEQEFIQYTSFHVLHNAGVSAQNLNDALPARPEWFREHSTPPGLQPWSPARAGDCWIANSSPGQNSQLYPGPTTNAFA